MNIINQQNIFILQKFNVYNTVKSQLIYHKDNSEYDYNVNQVYADLYAYYYKEYQNQEHNNDENIINKKKSEQKENKDLKLKHNINVNFIFHKIMQAFNCCICEINFVLNNKFHQHLKFCR